MPARIQFVSVGRGRLPLAREAQIDPMVFHVERHGQRSEVSIR
jgi:hypothetical protein